MAYKILLVVIVFVLSCGVLLSLHAPVDLGCVRIFSCFLPVSNFFVLSPTTGA